MSDPVEPSNIPWWVFPLASALFILAGSAFMFWLAFTS